MELRHLRYFVALAERLNFTATAKFLGIRQPPLSVQIRNLEAEIGQLFFREGKRVRLTPLGALLLDEARGILQQAEQTEQRLRDAAEGRSGEIRLAHTQGARSERVTRRLRKFLRKHRGIRLFATEVAYKEAETHFALGFDVLITECFEPPPGALILERSKLSVAVCPKHRLSDRPEASLSDLIGETLLLSPFEKRSALEQKISQDVEFKGIAISQAAVSSRFTDRMWLVSLGFGVAICSDTDRPAFDAIRIPLMDTPELLTVALSNPSSRSTVLPALLEAIRE